MVRKCRVCGKLESYNPNLSFHSSSSIVNETALSAKSFFVKLEQPLEKFDSMPSTFTEKRSPSKFRRGRRLIPKMSSNLDGESSRGNMDEEDTDPPKFKKARFLWEVKGNYHMKESDTMNNSNSCISHKNNPLDCCCNSQSNEQKVTNRCNSKLCNLESHSCIQSFLEKTEEILDADLDIPDDKLINVRCNNETWVPPFEKKDMDNYDRCFLKWHSKQMVRFSIENQINAALEACLGDGIDKYTELDISDIVEDVESDIEVKDEGILMAIESHGLKTSNQPVLDSGSPKVSSDSDTSNYEYLPNNSETSPAVPISGDFVLGTSMLNVNEMNCKDFWNTAVSAAIFEKGLSHMSE